MKDNFGKTTALIMGLLMIFPAGALAFSSERQESRRAEAWAESELIIAQNEELSQEDRDAISQLAVEAQTALGNCAAKLNSVSESDLPNKNVLSKIVFYLESTIGDRALLTENQVLTVEAGTVIVQAIRSQLTTAGHIAADLSITADSEEGRAAAKFCAEALASFDNNNINLALESIAEGES